MQDHIEIIAKSLMESLADVVRLKDKEIKNESFRIVFYRDTYSFAFFCSLHHLDMPWKLNLIISNLDTTEELEKKHLNLENPKNVSEYDITPIFLSNVETNSKNLANKIKQDLINLMQS